MAFRGTVVQFVLLCGVFISAGTCGDVIRAHCQIHLRTHWEDLLLSIGFGIALLVYLTFLLAALHLLYIAVIQVLFLLLASFSLFRVRHLKPNPPAPFHGGEIFLLAAILALGCLYLVGASAPTTDWDPQMYHFEVPNRYIQAHGFVKLPNGYSNFPQFMEMLNAFLMCLHGDTLAGMAAPFFGWLTTLVVFAIARRYTSRLNALWAGLLFLGTPIAGLTASIPYIDLGAAFFSLLAVLVLLEWQASGGQNLLTVGACVVGFALAIKYYNYILIVILAWAILRRRGWITVRDGVSVLAYTALALLFSLPWYLKNLEHIGDPIFPVFANLLGRWGKGIPRANWNLYGLGSGPLNFLLLPFRATFSDQFGGHIGMAFLLLLPLLLSLRKLADPVRWLARVFLLCLVFWFFSAGQSVRFFLTGIGLLCVVYAVLVDHAFRGKVIPKQIALVASAGILVIVNGLCFPDCGYAIFHSTRYLFSNQTRDEYLDANLDIYPVAEYANSHLPPNARIITVWEERGYYFDHPLTIGMSSEGAFVHAYLSGSQPDTLARDLRSRGYTHLLINDHLLAAYGGEFTLRDRYMYQSDTRDLLVFAPKFRDCYLTQEFEEKDIHLYQILNYSKCPAQQ